MQGGFTELLMKFCSRSCLQNCLAGRTEGGKRLADARRRITWSGACRLPTVGFHSHRFPELSTEAIGGKSSGEIVRPLVKEIGNRRTKWSAAEGVRRRRRSDRIRDPLAHFQIASAGVSSGRTLGCDIMPSVSMELETSTPCSYLPVSNRMDATDTVARSAAKATPRMLFVNMAISSIRCPGAFWGSTSPWRVHHIE